LFFWEVCVMLSRKDLLLAAIALIVGMAMISRAQATTIYSSVVLADAPRYYWNWDGTGATEANAATSGATGGTLVGDTTATRATSTGNHNYAGLSFGTGASLSGVQTSRWYADATHGAAPSDGTYGSYAIEFWVKLSATGAQYLVEGNIDTPSIIYGFSSHGLEMYAGSVKGRTQGTFSTLTTGAWHHVVVGYEAAAVSGLGSDRQFCIVDGNVAGKASSTGVQGRTFDATTSIAIGSTINAGSNTLNGMIDEVALYNLSGLANDTAFQAKLSHLAGHYNATPEPGTLVLLTTAMLGLLAYAWRKRR
jgi:hypothetical protein